MHQVGFHYTGENLNPSKFFVSKSCIFWIPATRSQI